MSVNVQKIGKRGVLSGVNNTLSARSFKLIVHQQSVSNNDRCVKTTTVLPNGHFKSCSCAHSGRLLIKRKATTFRFVTPCSVSPVFRVSYVSSVSSLS